MLLAIALKDFDNSIDEIGERRFPDTKSEKGENGIHWNAVIKKAVEKMSDLQKAQLLVEIMITNVWGQDRGQFMKSL